MRLEIYRTVWGYEEPPSRSPREVVGSLYDGIEMELPATGGESDFVAAMRDEALGYISLLGLESQDPGTQLEEFRVCVTTAAELEPTRMVMHSGRDCWPIEEAIDFYETIVGLEAELGVKVAHETHRGRALATPWATARILQAVPELRLCCDFSHWVVVCERLLADQEATMACAAARAAHIHSRVGDEQGPQVSDPAAPESAVQLAAFERWWEMIWDAHETTGAEVCTMTPEYGPPPYQRSDARPEELARKLARICDWQALRARRRFEERVKAPAGR